MARRRAATVAEQFAAIEHARGDHPALRSADVADGHWLTFAEVAELARAATALLAEHAAAFGDRIVLALPNSVILRILERGVLGAGMVRVALSPRLHAREIAAIAVDCDARIVCCTAESRDAVAEALAEAGSAATLIVAGDQPATGTMSPASLRASSPASAISQRAPLPGDIAMLMYSSGTTGRPKAAVVTHRTWVAQTNRALEYLPPLGSDDVVLAVAPMTHFGGSIGLDGAVCGAATLTMARFEPHTVLEAIREFGVTVLPLVPIMLERLARAAVESGTSTTGLRVVPYGGSPIGREALALAHSVFPGSLVQFYGLAEALAPLTVLTPRDHSSAADRLGSAGRVCRGVELRVADDDELIVRADTVMPGYWNRPELTSAVLSEGWFRTGDRGRIDQDGYVHLLGRSTDTIITGGFNVHPAEVERVLAELGEIREVAVVGLSHPVWGEGVTAAVVLEPAAGALSSQELLGRITAACAQQIAGYKKPVAVHIVAALPRNPAGKIDRAALRDLLSHREKD
ncbi:class I adenylate-forming enzyme family protein [Amycolatopsis taiwanensis]|uniref:class I adenylate-forming enzyme family protein n=1 Tax=Amycolatopsis taiwanensis TaxID=342230 RepID=UPI00146FC256|nr:class I adenylate-forming enzyme family protein [Amycolatopsis taiwanensis]